MANCSSARQSDDDDERHCVWYRGGTALVFSAVLYKALGPRAQEEATKAGGLKDKAEDPAFVPATGQKQEI